MLVQFLLLSIVVLTANAGKVCNYADTDVSYLSAKVGASYVDVPKENCVDIEHVDGRVSLYRKNADVSTAVEYTLSFSGQPATAVFRQNVFIFTRTTGGTLQLDAGTNSDQYYENMVEIMNSNQCGETTCSCKNGINSCSVSAGCEVDAGKCSDQVQSDSKYMSKLACDQRLQVGVDQAGDLATKMQYYLPNNEMKYTAYNVSEFVDREYTISHNDKGQKVGTAKWKKSDLKKNKVNMLTFMCVKLDNVKKLYKLHTYQSVDTTPKNKTATELQSYTSRVCNVMDSQESVSLYSGSVYRDYTAPVVTLKYKECKGGIKFDSPKIWSHIGNGMHDGIHEMSAKKDEWKNVMWLTKDLNNKDFLPMPLMVDAPMIDSSDAGLMVVQNYCSDTSTESWEKAQLYLDNGDPDTEDSLSEVTRGQWAVMTMNGDTKCDKNCKGDLFYAGVTNSMKKKDVPSGKKAAKKDSDNNKDFFFPGYTFYVCIDDGSTKETFMYVSAPEDSKNLDGNKSKDVWNKDGKSQSGAVGFAVACLFSLLAVFML